MRVLLTYFLLLTVHKASAQNGDIVPSALHPLPFGVYANSEDYFKLRPSDTEIVFKHIPQMEGNGINRFWKRKEDGKKGKKLLPNDYFAASNGNDVFIAYAGFWQKAETTDSGYYFISKRRRNEIDQRRFPHFTVGYGGDVTDVSAFVEDYQLYRYRYSLVEKRWIPMERVKKK